MLAHLGIELLAQDIIRDRIAQAEQAALAARLPRVHKPSFQRRARTAAANLLRAIAVRLEPTTVTERRLATARSR